ncbi:hypothetical protein QAD02_014817 [Eretmocerus hayati]|uniref:Uncharacterized protein n=1 Tax=Eretmocerus hayati TaxID=131215 RepID=A0ACC2P622_9HYME|nr:hypothetical protein QAD02_014817 [Eretmocerus hayati]
MWRIVYFLLDNHETWRGYHSVKCVDRRTVGSVVPYKVQVFPFSREVGGNSSNIETCSAFIEDEIREDQTSSDGGKSDAYHPTSGSNDSDDEINAKSNCSKESNDNFSLSDTSSGDDRCVNHLKKHRHFPVDVGNVCIRTNHKAFSPSQGLEDRPKYRALGAYTLKKYLGKTCPLRNYGDYRHTESSTAIHAIRHYKSHRQRFVFVVLQGDVIGTSVYRTECDIDEHFGR